MGTPEPGQHIYVCGPSGFMDFVLGSSVRFGWPGAQVHREYFTAPTVEHDANKAFEVELARSGKVLMVPANNSLFEVLDKAGIAIETSCEQGICWQTHEHELGTSLTTNEL
jgi:vanillate O-demethylase ferredoxin subunit